MEAVGEFHPEAILQRGMVHWYRNGMSVVPKTKVKEAMAMLKAIHAQEDRQAARDKAGLVADKLDTRRLSQAATIVRAGVDETLSCIAFPREHWTRIRPHLYMALRVTPRALATFICWYEDFFSSV